MSPQPPQATPGMVLDEFQLGQRLHVKFERPVERFVRNTLRHQPGQRQADGPQQQQRREHPVEDLAKQGALLALEDFQGYGLFLCIK